MDSPKQDVFIGSPGSGAHPAFFSSSESIHKIKVVLIGDVNVGKTSLAMRFSKDKFEENYKQTIGASFISKIAIVEGDVIHFQIWDTAGQERYKSLVPMYLRGAQIAFIVFDITDPDSFDHVHFWLDALQHHCDMATAVLVANKCDLESTIDQADALLFAQEHSLQFVTTSAKSGYNVDRLFHSIGSKVVNKLKRQSQAFPANRERNSHMFTGSSSVSLNNDDTRRRHRKKCCNK